MIGADCVRGLAEGALAFIDLSREQELYAISILAAVQGLAGSVFGPSESALLPEVVPAEDLTRANSLRTVVTPLANAVAGPAIGYEVGRGVQQERGCRTSDSGYRSADRS